jgi:hypothetical protein
MGDARMVYEQILQLQQGRQPFDVSPTGSWNTTPVKVSAAPRLVFRAPARMTPALTGMTVLFQ